jgi:hypothetical protein
MYFIKLKSRDENIENSKMTINECLKMVLTSEPFKPMQINSLQSCLNSKQARAYFAKTLFQNKFKDNKHQVLSENSFNDLFKMVFTALLLCDDTQMQYADTILITKCCFYYYRY